LPPAQHSIVCLENLPNPQIWVCSYVYVQTHIHKQQSLNRSCHYNSYQIPTETMCPNHGRTQRCYFWPHLLIPINPLVFQNERKKKRKDNNKGYLVTCGSFNFQFSLPDSLSPLCLTAIPTQIVFDKTLNCHCSSSFFCPDNQHNKLDLSMSGTKLNVAFSSLCTCSEVAVRGDGVSVSGGQGSQQVLGVCVSSLS